MTEKTVCAICKRRPIMAQYRPFCSKRCADVDLSRWLGGGYAIPGDPVDPATLEIRESDPDN